MAAELLLLRVKGVRVGGFDGSGVRIRVEA